MSSKIPRAFANKENKTVPEKEKDTQRRKSKMLMLRATNTTTNVKVRTRRPLQNMNEIPKEKSVKDGFIHKPTVPSAVAPQVCLPKIRTF